MSIRHIFQYYYYIVGTIFLFETLSSAQPINLVVEEISWNKPVVQTLITYFIHQKEKHVSIRHNTILSALFFRIEIIYMIYLDVNYLSVNYLSIYYDKLTAKTVLTIMGLFFSKKLNFCPSYIIWHSAALKCQCLKHTSKFLIHVSCISNKMWREISSPRIGQ